MTKKQLAVAVFAVGFMASPVFAHHGDAGRYEETISTISGTVVALKLVNPHSVIVVDVADDSGKIVRWQAELTGAAQLSRVFGWTRTTLKAGDKITMTGRRSKGGAPYFNLSERARLVRTDSGKELYRTVNYEDGESAGTASNY
jgi:Family of unknown function (DUF6152)